MIARFALLAALLAPPSVTRLSGAGGGEVVVTAEKVVYAFPKHRIDYTGKPVRLTRGDATLTCLRLGAQMDAADKIVSAVCEGDVRFDRGGKVVTCEKATYDEPAARLTCEGNPVLHSGGLVASGKLLVYDLGRDEVTMDEVHGSLPSADADAQLESYKKQRKGRPGGAR